jgi:hypothetical protein
MIWVKLKVFRCLLGRLREQARSHRFGASPSASGMLILALFRYEVAYEIRGFCLRIWQIHLLSGRRLTRNHGAVMGGGQDGKASPTLTASSQGRLMHLDDQKNVELERLQTETQKLGAERRKLLAEEAKLKLETFLYPLVVGAGALTAIATAVGLYMKA